MINPSRRLEHLTTSVFSEMAGRKREKLIQGIDMIDLSIGSPDQPPPQNIRKIFADEVLRDHSYQYAINSTQAFNEAVVYFYKERYGVELQPSSVLQLMGSQDGLAHIALAYLDEGDVIIVPDPGYPIYSACAHIAGAELYYVSLTEENQFMPDLEAIPANIRKRAKLMITNYPGNPTAALADTCYFEKLVQFGSDHNILILHDFAYSELIFDGREPLSIFSIPGAEKTALEFNSLSKSFNMAGARIGYVIGDSNFLQPLAVLKSHLDYGVFLPVQHAAVEALTGDFTFLDEHCQTYERRRNVFIQALNEIGWTIRHPDGGMFVWAKVPPQYTSMSFSLAALDAGVVVTPGNAFGNGGEGYVRIALVQNEEKLKEAAQRLKTIL